MNHFVTQLPRPTSPTEPRYQAIERRGKRRALLEGISGSNSLDHTTAIGNDLLLLTPDGAWDNTKRIHYPTPPRCVLVYSIRFVPMRS